MCIRDRCSTHPFTLHRSLRTRIVLAFASTLVSTSICKQILIDTKQICKGKPLQICRSSAVNETPDKKKRQKHQTNTRQKTPDQNTRQTPDMVRVRVKVEYVYMHFYLVFSSGVFCLLFLSGASLTVKGSSLCNCRIYYLFVIAVCTRPPPRPLTLVPWDWSLSCAATAMRSRLVLPIRVPHSVCVQPRALC